MKSIRWGTQRAARVVQPAPMESASAIFRLTNEVADLHTTVGRLRRQNVTLFVSVVALTISVLGLWCRP